jgi:predicted DNA-binding ribbon-helix-helix protein
MNERGINDSEPGRLRKRSVVIAGHRTSVSLENAFWRELRAIAEARGVGMNRLITEIDRTRNGNLSSAIRVYILARLASPGLTAKDP